MRRLLAAAILAVLALAGCAGGRSGGGEAAAAGRPPTDREVRLVVSRDFGTTVLKDVTVASAARLTVMRLLAEHATVDTQYGGGFVKAIDGLASTYGSVAETNAQDWFFWVDGVMADVGAGDYEVHGGETVWWDYHAWARAMYLPAAIDALPAPWTRGTQPLTANVDTTAVEVWAADNGIRTGTPKRLTDEPPTAGIVVATAAEAEGTGWLRRRIAGDDGGVALVETSGGRVALRELGGETGPLADGACLALPNPLDGAKPLLLLLVREPEQPLADGACLALPNPLDGAKPLLLLLVREPEQLQALLDRVTSATASARVGLAVVDGATTRLPWGDP